MTNTETTNDAKEIARAILDMKFADMITVMNAINEATGAKRGKVDGITMLKAAQLILDDKVGEPEHDPDPRADKKPTDVKKPASAKK